MKWNVGDKFRITQDNFFGGSKFGAPGDTGVISSTPDENVLQFRFESINTEVGRYLRDRTSYLDSGRVLNIHPNDIELLIIDYKADQVADASEDLL